MFPSKKSPMKSFVNEINSIEAYRKSLNFLPQKIRYRVNKKFGVVLTKTWYKTTYVCCICNKTVSFSWEGTKNTDVNMACDKCKEVVALLINLCPDIKDIIWPKEEVAAKNVVAEYNKKSKKMANTILNMIDAGQIDKETVLEAMIKGLSKSF